MEIKGEPKEIEKFFKKRNKKPFGITSSFRNMGNREKNKFMSWGLVCFILVVSAFLIFLIIEDYMSTKYLTQEQCNKQIDYTIRQLDVPWYQILWLKSIQFIPLFCVAVALGWIIHGVGFRII